MARRLKVQLDAHNEQGTFSGKMVFSALPECDSIVTPVTLASDSVPFHYRNRNPSGGSFPLWSRTLCECALSSVAVIVLCVRVQQQGNRAKRTILHRNWTQNRPEGGATVPCHSKADEPGGTVKVIAMVSPDGTVKKVDAVGGSPLLVQAAQDAVSLWKFAPGTSQGNSGVAFRSVAAQQLPTSPAPASRSSPSCMFDVPS